MTALDVAAAIAEVLSWFAWLVAVVGAVTLLVLSARQGPWHPVEAVVDHDDPGILRWFGQVGVGSARVRPEDAGRIDGRDVVPVFVRPDRHDTFRWERRGAAWRPVLWATVVAAVFAVVATVLSYLPRILA